MHIMDLSSLPWLLVVETLAGCSEITNATLLECIDAAPVAFDDFPENTKQLIALRCLEELCYSANGVNINNLHASSSSSSSLGSREYLQVETNSLASGELFSIFIFESERNEAAERVLEFHRQKHSKPQACLKPRRKRIPWTPEEEAMLREGVRKYGSDDQRMPWKQICAFGSHVFCKDDKHRMPQDLKDKWKTMHK